MSDSRNQGLYPKETIANLLNISERRIEQLSKQKIIPKAGRGVYDLGPTVQAYVRYLQGICNGSIHSERESDLDRRLREAQVLERESKARQAKYRADKMEQNLHIMDFRKRLSRIPEKATYEIVETYRLGEGSELRIRGLLRSLIDEALTDGEEH